MDFFDADFEDVAGLGFGNGDGAGQNMTSRATGFLGDLVVHVVEVGWDVFVGDAFGFEAGARAAGGEGLHDNGVAGMDGEDRFGVEVVVAPGDGGGRGEEGLRGLCVREGGRREGCGEEEKSFQSHGFV